MILEFVGERLGRFGMSVQVFQRVFRHLVRPPGDRLTPFTIAIDVRTLFRRRTLWMSGSRPLPFGD